MTTTATVGELPTNEGRELGRGDWLEVSQQRVAAPPPSPASRRSRAATSWP
jgi:hypothetical protein